MRKLVLLAATAAICLPVPVLAGGKPNTSSNPNSSNPGKGNGQGNAGGQGNNSGNNPSANNGSNGNSHGNDGQSNAGGQGNGNSQSTGNGQANNSGSSAGGNGNSQSNAGGESNGNPGHASGNDHSNAGDQGNSNAGGNGNSNSHADNGSNGSDGKGPGAGGGKGAGVTGPVACSVNDISLAALACSGFYAGNLLDNADVAEQITGLQAIGFTWDGDFNGLVAAGQKFDANGATTLNFTQPLSGLTVIGIHFGGGGPDGVGNGTGFYLLDAGTALKAIDLAYHGSSGVVIYSTGHHLPPPTDPVNGAVPEPASWAMMIGGFGMIGATLRRRRTAIRFA